MTKISTYPLNSSPTTTDYLIGNQASGPTTQRFLLSDLITLFLNSIPAAEGSSAFVSSGGVWSGDAYASTRAASMTAMRVRVVSTFLSVAAVTARTFTASKDTYIDVDSTGTLVYTEVANNAASPALAANSVRVGIIITGATTIASAASVNQGQEDKVLPIASSIAYTVTDSLGNLICPRDPNSTTLGYRQTTSNFVTTNTSATQVTGLTCPVIIPTGRKIDLLAYTSAPADSAGTAATTVSIWDGTVGSGTQLQAGPLYIPANNASSPVAVPASTTPAAASKTYNVGFHVNGSTGTFVGAATTPAFIKVKLA
jgi:hypothetical protein